MDRFGGGVGSGGRGGGEEVVAPFLVEVGMRVGELGMAFSSGAVDGAMGGTEDVRVRKRLCVWFAGEFDFGGNG